MRSSLLEHLIGVAILLAGVAALVGGVVLIVFQRQLQLAAGLGIGGLMLCAWVIARADEDALPD